MDFWERLDGLTANSAENNRKKVAEAAGISPSAIAMWKTRKSYPTADVAVRMARKLGVSVEYLIFGESSGLVTIKEMEFLQKAYRWRDVIERLDTLDQSFADSIIAMIRAAPSSLPGHNSMIGGQIPRAEGE